MYLLSTGLPKIWWILNLLTWLGDHVIFTPYASTICAIIALHGLPLNTASRHCLVKFCNVWKVLAGVHRHFDCFYANVCNSTNSFTAVHQKLHLFAVFWRHGRWGQICPLSMCGLSEPFTYWIAKAILSLVLGAVQGGLMISTMAKKLFQFLWAVAPSIIITWVLTLSFGTGGLSSVVSTVPCGWCQGFDSPWVVLSYR